MIDISKIIQGLGAAASALGAQKVNADAMAAHMRTVPVTVDSEIVDYGAIARELLAHKRY